MQPGPRQRISDDDCDYRRLLIPLDPFLARPDLRRIDVDSILEVPSTIAENLHTTSSCPLVDALAVQSPGLLFDERTQRTATDATRSHRQSFLPGFPIAVSPTSIRPQVVNNAERHVVTQSKVNEDLKNSAGSPPQAKKNELTRFGFPAPQTRTASVQ